MKVNLTDKEIKSNVSKAIKERQKKFYPHMTNPEFATLLNVKMRTFKGWRDGNSLPESYADLLNLSKALRCSVDFLLTGKEKLSGDDYLAQQTGLSLEAIKVLQKNLPDQEILDQFNDLLIKRNSILSELQSVLYRETPKKDRKMNESPEEIELRETNEIENLMFSLKPELTDQQLKDVIAQIYPQAFQRENKNESVEIHIGDKNATVVPTYGFIRKGLFPTVKKLYLEYCEIRRRTVELRPLISGSSTFIDTLDRVIRSEKVIEDISKYLNARIQFLWIDDASTSGHSIHFEKEHTHGAYDPETGAVWLDLHDGQPHKVKINSDLIIDEAIIRKLFIERIAVDLDSIVRAGE